MTVDAQIRVLQKICGDRILKEVLGKLAAMELQKCERALATVDDDLATFEKRFGKSSRDAWEAYRAGAMGDDPDVMEWMAVFENRLALETSIDQLQKTIEP
ncbi:MAG: hypothetical protein HQM09_19620 [Candidatus Riflebacteria bacterium]|nr:hypothetical protein [Candidatus Riflebacteria bacterium]